MKFIIQSVPVSLLTRFQHPKTPRPDYRPALASVLSAGDLRRIVAEMID